MKVLVILSLSLACAMAQFHLGGHQPMHPHPMGERPSGRPPMGPHGMHPHPMGERPSGRPPMGPHGMHPHPMGERPSGRPPMGPHGMHPHPMGERPSGRPPMGPHGMHPHPMGQSNQFWNQLKAKIASWKNSQTDEDETAIVSLQGHLAGFRNHINGLFANRPTGRPGNQKQLLDNLKIKFKEILKNLQAERPTGRPGRKAHGKARDRLRKIFNKAKQQIKHPETEDEDETEITFVNSAKKHFSAMRKLFNNLLMNRPTGRPSKAELSHVAEKFREAVKTLQGFRPTGRPLKADLDIYRKFLNKLKMLKEHTRTEIKHNHHHA